MEQIKLGGFVIENVENINNNFAELETNKANNTDIPTNVSQLVNDKNYQTKTDVSKVIKDLSFNDKNGIITVTFFDDTTTTIDTKLEKVVTNFQYNATSGNLELTLEDGSVQSIPMGAFLNDYEGSTNASGTIAISSSNVISFTLASGAVAWSNLNTSVQNRITALEGEAHSHSNKTILDGITASFTTDDETKLNGIEVGANKTITDSALSNTSINPVQNKVVTSALDGKVEKISGKGLSTNDYTTTEKNKLSGIEANANNYSLPTSSTSQLGGVKVDGSSIKINSSGVISAEGKSKITFTTSSSWVADNTIGTETYQKLTVSTNGKTPFAVYKKSGNDYEQIFCMLKTDASDNNCTIASLQSFEGFILCI